jgi:hypothetical protein
MDEMPHNGRQRRVMLTHLAIVLFPGRQLRKGRPQMVLRRAVKAALTANALPLSAYGQGHHLTSAEGGLRSRVSLKGQGGRAKVIHHNVQSSEEGVDIDHSNGSLSWGR